MRSQFIAIFIDALPHVALCEFDAGKNFSYPVQDVNNKKCVRERDILRLVFAVISDTEM